MNRTKVPNCETRIVIRGSAQVCDEEVLSESEQPYEPDQGYYNTGWFKNDLSACWSYIRYPKRIS